MLRRRHISQPGENHFRMDEKAFCPKRIRLVILIGGLDVGGSERQLYLLLEHIDRTWFDCHVVVFNPTQDFLRSEIEKLGVAVWPVPDRFDSILKRMLFVFRVLRKLRPQIVHSWSFHGNPYAGLVGWFAGVPVRLGSQRSAFSSKSVNALPFVFRFLALYTVSRIVVNSEAASREMVAQGYPISRIVLVPNFLDSSSQSRTDPSQCLDLSFIGIGARHRVIGIIGNLRSEKNHLMFVQAMGSILPCFSDVRGLIVGQCMSDEPDVQLKIKSAIKDLKLDGKIAFAGFRTDVPTLMRRMHLFCLTSDYEGMPNVVLEAMALARPIVATRVGGVPEVVKDGINGFLVEPGDVEGFARKVKYLLSNPDLSRKMGLAGREIVVRNFACEKAVQRITEIYSTSLEEKGVLFR